MMSEATCIAPGNPQDGEMPTIVTPTLIRAAGSGKVPPNFMFGSSSGFCVALIRQILSSVVGPWLLPNSAEEKFLAEARRELAELDEYAVECDIPSPSPKAKETALQILEQIVPAVPRYYAVSLWNEGEVIVHTTDAAGRRVSVYCDAQGGTSAYAVQSKGATKEQHRRPEENPPMNFILQALKGMSP